MLKAFHSTVKKSLLVKFLTVKNSLYQNIFIFFFKKSFKG